MKLSKMGLLTALVLGGLVVCSNMAFAQDAGKKGGKRGFSPEQQLERMNEQLKLTDAQKPKVKAVLEETSKKRQELGDVPQDQRREKYQALRDEENKKLKAILTSEQYEKWQKAMEEMRSKGGQRKKKSE